MCFFILFFLHCWVVSGNERQDSFVLLRFLKECQFPVSNCTTERVLGTMFSG